MVRVPDLLRKGPFQRYWIGQSVSQIGDEVSRVVIPLAAVLLLQADAADMGWLTAAALLPALLFSMPFGAWADGRASRRRVMIGADLGRFLAMISLPLAYYLDVLTLAHLYVTVFVIGTLDVLFDVCDNTLYASIVPADRYVLGSSLVNGSRALAVVSGPGIGGFLVQLVAAPLAMLLDAVSYLVSAGFLSRISTAEPRPAPREKGHFTAGVTWIARTPTVRSLLAAVATMNFFNFVFHALFTLYVTRELGLSAGTLGLIIGCAAIGGLAGAVFAGDVVARFGIGPALALGFLGYTLPLVLVPAAGGPQPVVIAMLFLAQSVSSCGVMILDISSNAFKTALIPDPLRARVSGAWQTTNYGVRPLGAIAGGLLGTVIGLRPSLWIATVGAVLGILWLLASPLVRTREISTAASEPEPARPAADAADHRA
ncbi:MFS transporter [Nonomuraea sp. NPDC050451]|uniref:MFS transporter n=1 Tax=Nonomuraea sp. NPDC050451 TaxID=3364364 RepID=UPI00378894D2